MLCWTTEHYWAVLIDQFFLSILLMYTFWTSYNGLHLLEWTLVSMVLMVGAVLYFGKKFHEEHLDDDQEDLIHAGFHLCFIAGFHMIVRWHKGQF